MSAPFHIITLPRVNSTNSYAKKIAAQDGIDEWTVISASEQTAGKGLGRNEWVSEPGKNLTFSIILYPNFIQPHGFFMLSIVASLGITDFFKSMIPAVSIKWPNDIYAGNDKIAGILIENSMVTDRIEYSVMGAGINVNQTYFDDKVPNPVSLKQLTGTEHDPGKLLPGLLRCIHMRYLQLRKDEWEILHLDYLNRLYRYREYHVYIAAGKRLMARIINVEQDGMLVLETEQKEQKQFGFKEVEYVL